MRGLNCRFMQALRDGDLAALREVVAADRDLILEIRENALDVYFKGNRLLRLDQTSAGYPMTLDDKFRVEALADLTSLRSASDTEMFVAAIPAIKERIVGLRRGASEIECEQMLIRANNCELRLNTEYFIIDRQLVTGDQSGQMDLIAAYWPLENRAHNREVALVLMEVKYGLNPDIRKLPQQLSRYHDDLDNRISEVTAEAETLLRQKVELGLFVGTLAQLEALKTLTVSRRIEDVRYVVVLVDYNPWSKLLDLDLLRDLEFGDRIDIFHVGFALWRRNAEPIAAATAS
ncbi:MAG: hypothetical protein ACE5JM_10015 [Armatimonadota bacterium]